MKKVLAVLLAILMLSAAAFATDGFYRGKQVIGVSLPHMTSPAPRRHVQRDQGNGGERQQRKLGSHHYRGRQQYREANVRRGGSDHRGVDAIIMCPIATDPLVPVSRKYRPRAFPLILIDRTIATEDYDYYVGGNNYQIGVLAAEYIGEKLNGEGNVVIIQGTLGGSATNDRQAGFIDTIAEKYPNLVVLGRTVRRMGARCRHDRHGGLHPGLWR